MRSDTAAERAARRRFTLLVLLHHGPRRTSELIKVLDKENLYDRKGNGSTSANQQLYQFRRDIHALRLLDCDITHDRRTGCYIWNNSPFGLSLDQSQLATFAVLLNTFADSTVLHAGDIQALLAFLKERLPREQQKTLDNQRHPFSIDLHETTDYRNADPETIGRIERAIQRGQQLEFWYRSPREGKERRHVIEPRPLVFERGHVYLYGWSVDHQKDLRFRLDYILPGRAKMLSTSIVRNRPSPISYVLKYQLSPVIARNSVSQHFSGQIVETHPDGSATITARITDLFDARRILLSYGENCTVLEPPELVKQMRVVTAEFSRKYLTREK
jgi:predicted DNA-binding transcriptional regulator YafY